MPVPQSCYSLDLPELGMIAGYGRFGVIQHICSWEEMFGCICVRREAAITDRESLRHIRVHHHKKQTVSSQMKNKNPKATIFERTRDSSSAGKCNAQ